MPSGYASTDKNVSIEALVARVPDGASVALGGSFLHRGPFAFVRELIRQKKKDLEIIKQSPGYDIDILCRAGQLIGPGWQGRCPAAGWRRPGRGPREPCRPDSRQSSRLRQ